MTQAPYFEFMQSLLVPVVTVVVAAAVGAFQDWRVRRSQTGRRKLTLDDARAQVAFVSEWWEASGALGLAPSVQRDAALRAQTWLAEASQRVAATPLPEPSLDQPGVWRRLLLAYPLRTRAARAVRVTFYLVLGWTPIVLGAGASNLGMSQTDFARYDLVIAAAAVVIGVALRALAIAIDRHASHRAEAGGPEHGLFRTALLLHRLRVPAARAGRLAMYAVLIGFLAYVIHYLAYWAQRPRAATGYLPLTAGTSLALIATLVGVRSWTLHLERRNAAAESTTADHDTTAHHDTTEEVTS